VRFAFKTSPQHTTWAALLDVWRAADDIEVFESGWNSDHFYPMHGADPTGPRLEAWTTLAALAQATRRLRLGTLVTGIHYRHPAVLANMAATLDIVSGGRLELGIGTGWNEQESGAYGIPLGTPRERSDRFLEACEVLTGLLSPPQRTTPATRAGPPRTPPPSPPWAPGWRSSICGRRTHRRCSNRSRTHSPRRPDATVLPGQFSFLMDRHTVGAWTAKSPFRGKVREVPRTRGIRVLPGLPPHSRCGPRGMTAA
jgi:alkanesulfonate monooxygenase SsuD/methylene tetrahydromethanopterin reductase-like flavin-dependent oxidoreductase (luciferase family)